MADGDEFTAWWEATRSRARQRNRRPITHYETALGPATLRQNPDDPTDVWLDVEIEHRVDTWAERREHEEAARARHEAEFGPGTYRPGATDIGERWRSDRVTERFDLGDPRLGNVAPVRGHTREEQELISRERGSTNFSTPEFRPRTLGERFMSEAWAAQQQGSGFLQIFGNPETGERNWSSMRSASREADMALIADQDLRDPFYAVGDSWFDLDRWSAGAATLGGTFAGAISDPTNLIMGGETMLSRVLFQGAFGATQSTGYQLSPAATAYREAAAASATAMELERLQREGAPGELEAMLEAGPPEEDYSRFDFVELGIATAASALLQGAFEVGGRFNMTREGVDYRRAELDAMGTGYNASRFNPRGMLDPSAEWRASGFTTPDPERPGRRISFTAAHAPSPLGPRPPTHLERALGSLGAPFIRAAARAHVRSLGDPELDAIARRPDGSIDPAALSIDEAFASTPVWLQQMAPVVERAGAAMTGQERVRAYSEAAIRLQEAIERGDDPIEFAAALAAARVTDSIPNLKAIATLEMIAREMAAGRLVVDQLGSTARQLAALTEMIDPAVARLSRVRRTFRRSLVDADEALGLVRREEAEARPPVEQGVGDAHMAPKRTITDDERADIDDMATRIMAGRETLRGESLASWVVSRGGLRDDGGDVRHAIGGTRARPGLTRSGGGKGVDDLIIAAVEEGFFPELRGQTNLDGRILIDALAEEVNGRQVRYASAAARERADMNDQIGELEAWLDRNGVDLTTIRDIEHLKRELADKVYEATYAVPVDEAPDGAPILATPGDGAATGGKATRQTPMGWGMRQGQAAGMGGGGAQRSPLARVESGITPIERQTFFRRQSRNVRRRGATTYVRDVLARAYTAVFEAQHPMTVQMRSLVQAIEEATGARVDLKASENPRILARLSRDGYSPGHLDLVDGVRPYRQPNVKASPSFREAIETATGGKEWTQARITRFEAYLIARRAVKAWDRYERGELPRPPHAMSKMDLEDAIRQAEADHPEFTQASALLYQFLAAHWQKKRDAGLITEDQFQAGLKNNEDYVPFQRDMDDSGADPSRGGEDGDAPAVSGGRTNKRRAFQRFRGSDRRILSPLSTIMADVYATSDRIARNETFRAFVDLAERAGEAGELIAKRIPRPMDRTRIDIADEARRAVRQAGGSELDADNIAGRLDALLDGETSHVIYRPGEVVEGNRNIIYVWRDGTREAWELTDPEWSRDLFKAMTGLTQEARDLFVDVVAVPTQTIRTAITAWPGFQIANIIRDSLSSWMVTNVKIKPGESLTHGVAQSLQLRRLLHDIDNVARRWTKRPPKPYQGNRIFGGMDAAQVYNAVGTQGGGIVRAGLPRSHLERDLPSLRGKTLRMRNLNPVEGALALWRVFEQATELSENASRIRLFSRAYQRAKARGESDYDAALWAAYESRDYLDFQRSGSKTLNFRRLALFFNAALQGLDRTVRTMTNEGDVLTMLKPLDNLMQRRTLWADMTEQERYQVGRAWRYYAALSLVGVFGMMLTALNADDEDYQYGFSDYTKNNYWLMRQGQYWILIPKPFEHAVMSNILERSYEATYGDDPLAWDRMVRGLGETYLPPTEITAANVPMQLWANRTATGAPIVPEGLEDLDPHLQYTWTTSALSIRLAEELSQHGHEVSPAQLDHVMGGTFGEFFRTPARATTQAQPNAPAMNASDFPVINRFLREPGRGGTPQRVAFYDDVMRQSGDLNRAAGTLRELIERGDADGAERFMQTREAWERRFAVLQVGFDTEARRLHPATRARAVITEIGRLRRELNGARPLNSETMLLPDMTPRQRRDALEALDDLSSVEMQAALVMAEAPGFAGRAMLDVRERYDRLDTVAPGVAATLRARLVSGDNKAIDFETMRTLWPEARRRLDAQGFNARLDDLARRAERDFGSETLRAMELRRQGGRRRTQREQDRERESFQRELAPQ